MSSSKSPKVLNIDAYAEPERELIAKGESYKVEPVSLKTFIHNLALAEELEQKGEQTARDKLTQAMDAVRAGVPTLPESVLLSLSPGQLAITLGFINGDFDEAAIQQGLIGAAAAADDAAGAEEDSLEKKVS